MLQQAEVYNMLAAWGSWHIGSS